MIFEGTSSSKEAVLSSLLKSVFILKMSVGMTLNPTKSKRAVHESMAARHARGEACFAIAEQASGSMVYGFRRDPVPMVSRTAKKEEARRGGAGRPQSAHPGDLDECSEEFFVCELSRQKAGLSRHRHVRRRPGKRRCRPERRSSETNRSRRHGSCYVDKRTRKEIHEQLAMEAESVSPVR